MTTLKDLKRLCDEATVLPPHTQQAAQDGMHDCPTCDGNGVIYADHRININGRAMNVFMFSGFVSDYSHSLDFYKTARNTLPRLIEVMEEMARALNDISGQMLSDDMDQYDRDNADWMGGYDECVKIARKARKAYREIKGE